MQVYMPGIHIDYQYVYFLIAIKITTFVINVNTGQHSGFLQFTFGRKSDNLSC